MPSSTALATSDASALVGSGARIIDSSIWVAVITVQAASRAVRMISFCTNGTSATPISTPRSPRATIRASLAATISSRLVTASAFSILAITRAELPCSRIRSRRSRTSSALRTNDSAT